MKSIEKLNKLSELRKQADQEVLDTIVTSSEASYRESSKLERTSITLRKADVDAIKALSLFFMENSTKRMASSTLIQIALQVAAKNISKFHDDFLEIQANVIESDMRKGKQ